ncbi:1-phosphofructokinase [Parendozoicomonas haliclonae]|uniref:Phosphofructokinase n=1 Tax=Parendozoicomonas haliclonae TaxID=1960125 RepID=A0A1X7ARM1_9GAMM|nr:1-phosphofructokinase [Parendozoicomonas haliclonae]SMA50748.1 Tagatose-6-phosphate kinase [Parendozoicomonas haliclonae]
MDNAPTLSKDKPVLTVTLNPALDLTIHCQELTLDAVNIADSGTLHAAGKGINVSKVLADLGADVNATGIFGRNNRDKFDAFFHHEPVEDHGVYVAGDTRINVKIKDGEDRVTEINLPGLQLTDEHRQQFRTRLLELAEQSDWVVLAGSLPKSLPADYYGELIKDLNEMGVDVILDTSGAALSEAIEARPYLIKPNRFELEQWFGGPVTTLEQEEFVVQQLLDKGIANVVVSDGSKGSRWYTETDTWQAVPPSMRVVSTVGAGDSLVAGITWGLSQGQPPEQCLLTATAVAALAVTQIGVGIPDHQQLDSLRSQIQLDKLTSGGV